MLLTALLCLGAVLLDRQWGEPRRWHPLVGFGDLARRVETLAYGPCLLYTSPSPRDS